MKLRPLILLLCLFAGVGAYAHDFTATVNGQRFCFEITDTVKKTAAVTYNGSIADKRLPQVQGIVEIPAKVKHADVIYEVKAIGPKAFSNAKVLSGIVIPTGITSIGDFAFENCDSLKNIIFPSNPVSFGKGVFFNCNAIEGVTIGTDWKTVDFSMFRWSGALKAVTVPARIEKIQGLKKLKNLVSVTVDPNNGVFSSHDGMLYSKDGTVFFACPRGFAGDVTVKDGVKRIQTGSLMDCVLVTSIDFPKTLENVSFRETSRMKRLQTVRMRNERPIFTGYINGAGRFLFQLADPGTRIVVNNVSRNAYLEALTTQAGEYRESIEGIPYEVSVRELPSRKNIKGSKP